MEWEYETDSEASDGSAPPPPSRRGRRADRVESDSAASGDEFSGDDDLLPSSGSDDGQGAAAAKTSVQPQRGVAAGKDDRYTGEDAPIATWRAHLRLRCLLQDRVRQVASLAAVVARQRRGARRARVAALAAGPEVGAVAAATGKHGGGETAEARAWALEAVRAVPVKVRRKDVAAAVAYMDLFPQTHLVPAGSTYAAALAPPKQLL